MGDSASFYGEENKLRDAAVVVASVRGFASYIPKFWPLEMKTGCQRPLEVRQASAAMIASRSSYLALWGLPRNIDHCQCGVVFDSLEGLV